jgi:diadenosine tetraphosphate (Ap4A) HIT family hydrolase
MCADIQLDENPFSFKIAELRQSYVRLPKNQYMRGWTIVALRRHASELFELSDAELSGFWKDVAQVAKALDRIYRPTKISYSVMGFRCPHVHCHLCVFSYDDDPHKPIDMNEKEVLLPPSEYQTMIGELRNALEEDLTENGQAQGGRDGRAPVRNDRQYSGDE